MNHKDILDKAEEISKTKRAGENFKHIVFMKHCDGTICEFHYADLQDYTTDYGEKWHMIFTEHNGFHVYHNEDLEYCYSDERSNTEKSIRMVNMDIDLDEKVYNGLVDYALENIKDDKEALINYAVNKALGEIVRTDGECLKDKE